MVDAREESDWHCPECATLLSSSMRRDRVLSKARRLELAESQEKSKEKQQKGENESDPIEIVNSDDELEVMNVDVQHGRNYSGENCISDVSKSGSDCAVNKSSDSSILKDASSTVAKKIKKRKSPWTRHKRTSKRKAALHKRVATVSSNCLELTLISDQDLSDIEHVPSGHSPSNKIVSNIMGNQSMTNMTHNLSLCNSSTPVRSNKVDANSLQCSNSPAPGPSNVSNIHFTPETTLKTVGSPNSKLYESVDMDVPIVACDLDRTSEFNLSASLPYSEALCVEFYKHTIINDLIQSNVPLNEPFEDMHKFSQSCRLIFQANDKSFSNIFSVINKLSDNKCSISSVTLDSFFSCKLKYPHMFLLKNVLSPLLNYTKLQYPLQEKSPSLAHKLSAQETLVDLKVTENELRVALERYSQDISQLDREVLLQEEREEETSEVGNPYIRVIIYSHEYINHPGGH